jgi:hypothetical protein
MSGDAHRHIRETLPLHFTDLGAHQVKNIAEPAQAYRINLDRAGSKLREPVARRPALRQYER